MSKPKYTQENLAMAYDMVQSKAMSLNKAAKHFGVPKTTLRDKLRGKHPLEKSPKTILSEDEETKLASWLMETARRGCGRSKEQLLRTVQQVLKADGRPNPFKDDKPGDKWYGNFLKRHPELSKKKTQALGQQRAIITEASVRAWFAEAEEVLAADNIDIKSVAGDRIFNCDETGFPFHTKTGYVLAAKEDKQVYSISNDSKQQITVLGCGSASGQLLKPLIIYPGQRFFFNPQEQFPESDFARSANGWIDSEIFFQWLKNTFIPAIRTLTKPVFLFVDGHTSHISMDIHYLCKEAGIVYYTLPAHASHIVQPLDLVIYKALKSEWASAVAAYRDLKGDNIKKDNFAIVLRDAWRRAYSPEKLINAFEAAGLCPWNPDRVNYKKCSASRSFTSTTPSQPVTPSQAGTPSQPDTPSQQATPSQPDAPSQATPSQQDTPSAEPYTSPQLVTPSQPGTSSQPDTPLQLDTSPLQPDTPSEPSPQTSGFYVDRLLELVVANKWNEATLFNVRRCYEEQKECAEPGFNEYVALYRKLVPARTFDTLPFPEAWGSKAKRCIRVQPPKYVSGGKFVEFFDKKKEAAKKKQEEKDKRQKAREDRKRQRELEAERKKAAREAKQQTKGKRGKGKRDVVESDESESERDIVYMDESSYDSVMVDTNACAACGGGEAEESGWVGCDSCERWYHRGCLGGRHERIKLLSEKDLEGMDFVCDVCTEGGM